MDDSMTSSGGDVGWPRGAFSDLLTVVIFTTSTGLFVFLPLLRETPLRPVLALIFILFVPGYTVVIASLPKKEHHRRFNWKRGRSERADTPDHTSVYLEMLVLSFGVSVALAIVLGLGLGLTEGGINRTNLFSGLALITGFFLILTAIRRRSVPSEEWIHPPIFAAAKHRWSTIFTRQSTTETVLNVVLIAAVLLAVTSVGMNLATPQDTGITEFALLSQNADGEYVATDYPSSLTRGASEPFAVRIQNQEGRPVTYTVVVLLQRFEEGNERREPLRESELQRFEETLENGEAQLLAHSITPSALGSNYRLTYLLYTDTAPSDPSIDNAYRELHIWVEVEPPSEQ